MRLLRLKTTLLIAFLLLLLPFGGHEHLAQPASAQQDMLVYWIQDTTSPTPPTLTLYDPSNGVSTPLPTDFRRTPFSLSSDGRLAFEQVDGARTELYVLNTRALTDPPIDIAEVPLPIFTSFPLEWSPDGRYLAFVMMDGSRFRLNVWDGTAISDITPE